MQVVHLVHLPCAGGSAGIGKATALQFDANGASVAIMGRRLERLEAVVKQMKHGFPIVADLTKSEEMGPAIRKAIEHMGGLDILVNCGGALTDEMQSDNEEAYLSAIKLHVTGDTLLLPSPEVAACSFSPMR